eukprot:CAMPEP_0201514536 /NCGR_PEP_ID=MMETSP0161_2-20130828/6354_1 /ASSEMBLY_ACC=CAM_ASM_000251 /TAXON_ID=180227 /ORGANISM="Neoparamoeba aestuarina, Strain SoJaBio B1-5/56/2" /LENGTH=268 /DNA_ID=CAMNT_0047911121 /DNA_START=38 /DNA_END=844 /DNA_ORIENTATION=-
MLVLYSFLFADLSDLGRLDYASLSQQTLMEMFIDGIDNRELICGSQENPKDISEWKGMSLSNDGEVTQCTILTHMWENSEFTGPVSIQWLPRTVESLRIHGTKLSGSVDFTSLPEKLRECGLTYNLFQGEVATSQLPQELGTLKLTSNQFFGSLDLGHLPKPLCELDVSKNAFSGPVSVGNLPSGLKTLNLSQNQFSGGLDLTDLSESLEVLYLSVNRFEGETDFSQLPKGLKKLSVSFTKLSGEIVVKKGMSVVTTNSKVKTRREKK